MKTVWIVRDMDRVDTGDEAQGHVVAIFADRDGALETRKRLEAREHSGKELGYVYHFEIEEHVVHESAFPEDYISEGHVDELSPPRCSSSAGAST